MSPASPTFFCIGLCVLQVIQTQSGPLPKPSLQAQPSSLVPLGQSVILRCQGPPDVDLYRLEKLKPEKYEDQDFLFIPTMERSNAGRYRCSYQNGSHWSLPSDQLELIATGVYAKPSLSAHPSSAVPQGRDVTLKCQSPYSFDEFVLYKEGDTGSYKRPEKWYRANFPIITVTAAHSGTYRCYSFSSSSPYLWSAPSDPLVLVVTGLSATPSQVPTEESFPVTAPGCLPRWNPDMRTADLPQQFGEPMRDLGMAEDTGRNTAGLEVHGRRKELKKFRTGARSNREKVAKGAVRAKLEQR